MIQAIVFFPLIGALVAGLLGRVIGHRTSEYVTTGLLIVAAALIYSQVRRSTVRAHAQAT